MNANDRVGRTLLSAFGVWLGRSRINGNVALKDARINRDPFQHGKPRRLPLFTFGMPFSPRQPQYLPPHQGEGERFGVPSAADRKKSDWRVKDERPRCLKMSSAVSQPQTLVL